MLPKEVLLSHFPKHTHKRYQAMMSVFSSLERLWQAEFDDIKKTGLDDNLIGEFLEWRDSLNEEVIKNNLEKNNIKFITIHDENYPKLLKQIYDPPICLFVRGELKINEFSLSVVGTRKFTNYGREVVNNLISKLAKQGITIVSGLALGIDGLAHEATLYANGQTIAVLGTGIDDDTIYPRAHINLAKKIIASGGAVISEYPPKFLATKFSFPRRNRIIAGLTLGTLVIEAGENSGSLITAQCSIDNNREVFAVPQNITSPSGAGSNNLLKIGAHAVTSAEDIINILGLQNIKEFVNNREIIPDSPTEAKILEHLKREPLHVDMIIKNSGLESHIVTSTLTLMEMKGKIRNIGGMMYVLAY